MMLLAAAPTTSFNEIARDAALTAGNLATHLKALEAVGYVESARRLVEIRSRDGGEDARGSEGRVSVKPRMRYAISDKGRDALRSYCRSLEDAVRRLQDLTGGGPTSLTDRARDS